MMRVREVRLKRYPNGLPQEGDFELAERELASPGDGELRLRPLYLSIDAYQRNRMRGPAAALQPGQIIEGRCVAEVAVSRHERFAPGDLVFATTPWADGCIVRADTAQRLDPEIRPAQLHLGAAGIPGLTAFVGLHDIGRLQPGETVVVSAAAGAVGSMACQIAKLQGCEVVGIVGSATKARWLMEEIGLDHAVDYSAEDDLATALQRRCPNGVDLVFECVGGRQLEAGLSILKAQRRVVLCGLIGGMNGASAAPRNLDQLIMKRLTIRGFVVGDHMYRMAGFLREMKAWLAAGTIRYRDTVIDGLENAPRAFIGLFRGENLGKMLVRVAEPASRSH